MTLSEKKQNKSFKMAITSIYNINKIILVLYIILTVDINLSLNFEKRLCTRSEICNETHNGQIDARVSER